MVPRRARYRYWRVVPQGSGWVLVHRDHGGYVFTVKPTDAANGDSLDDCRRYIATNARSLDLYIEPDGRIFWMLRAVAAPAPPTAPAEEFGKRAMRVQGEIRLVMPEAEA